MFTKPWFFFLHIFFFLVCTFFTCHDHLKELKLLDCSAIMQSIRVAQWHSLRVFLWEFLMGQEFNTENCPFFVVLKKQMESSPSKFHSPALLTHYGLHMSSAMFFPYYTTYALYLGSSEMSGAFFTLWNFTTRWELTVFANWTPAERSSRLTKCPFINKLFKITTGGIVQRWDKASTGSVLSCSATYMYVPSLVSKQDIFYK